MKGMFRLYYQHELAQIPGAGVRYEVHSSRGAIAASGKTDAQGQTLAFSHAEGSETFKLLVHDGTLQSPETVDGEHASSELALKASANAGMSLQVVRLKPRFKVAFLIHPGRKPIVGAAFKAYALDARGRKVLARDAVTGAAISGATTANGWTGVFYCATKLMFEFKVPGTSLKVHSPWWQPLLQGMPGNHYELTFKTAQATTQLAPDHQTTVAGKKSAPLLISPADEELIMVPQRDFEEFEELSGRLDKIMAATHQAKFDLSRALESQNTKDIAAAEKALGLAEDKVKSELNKNFAKATDLKEVITVEAYNKGPNSKTGASQMGLRRRYLRADKYMELRNKRINKAEYKLSIKFSGAAGTKAGASVSPKTLDVAALQASFDKIKTSLKSSREWKTETLVFDADFLGIAGGQFAKTLAQSDTYQVDAQAQWMRFVASAGANSEIDWKAKKALLQGNAQAKLVLCEAKANAQWAVPSPKGWMMSLDGEDLGAVRFVVEIGVFGFVGAKAVATGAVGISLEGGKQVAKAIKRDKADSIGKAYDPKSRLPRFEAAGAHEKAPDDLNGLQADIDVFAGVEAGLTPAGKIQWLPPQEKEFVSFAEISGTVAVSAGAGAQGQLTIYFAGGKFKVKAAARLCWGVGCKGAVEFTVDASKLLEFAKWVSYQLAHAGFRHLVHFEKESFMALSQLMLLLTAEGSPAHQRIQEIASNVDQRFRKFSEALETARERNALVNNIVRKPDWLVYATPETRGMLLYQITRHGTPSHMRDTPSVEGSLVDFEVHYLDRHKEAVCAIMSAVPTVDAWENVMQHMTVRGEKSGRSAGKSEGDVLRFLNNGMSLADLPDVMDRLNRTQPVMEAVSTKKGTGNRYLDEYLKSRAKLKGKFPKGYTIASVIGSPLEGDHPLFGEIQTACLGEAYAGDAGSSVT
jgi:hypothetical protein